MKWTIETEKGKTTGERDSSFRADEWKRCLTSVGSDTSANCGRSSEIKQEKKKYCCFKVLDIIRECAQTNLEFSHRARSQALGPHIPADGQSGFLLIKT